MSDTSDDSDNSDDFIDIMSSSPAIKDRSGFKQQQSIPDPFNALEKKSQPKRRSLSKSPNVPDVFSANQQLRSPSFDHKTSPRKSTQSVKQHSLQYDEQSTQSEQREQRLVQRRNQSLQSRNPAIQNSSVFAHTRDMDLRRLVRNIQMKPPSESSSSKSVIFYATLIPQTLDGTVYGEQDVVVKMSVESSPRDNSLEVERGIYMLTKRAIARLTPHLLRGIVSGWCRSEAMYHFKDSRDREEQKLYAEWELLCAKVLWDRLSSDDRLKYADVGYKGLINTPKFTFQRQSAHYIITPRMKGVPIATFFLKKLYDSPSFKIPDDQHPFDVLIAMQVAQTLAVLELFEMRHNDLHDKNVYVEYFQTPQVIRYTYPFPYRLTTHFVVTIFDFDHSATPMFFNHRIENAFCAQIGDCNKFEKNWDWYIFLVYFIRRLKQHVFQPKLYVPTILGSELFKEADKSMSRQIQVGNDAYGGRACQCNSISVVSGKASVCTRCTVRTKMLQSLQSPADFYMQIVKAYPNGNFT